VITVKYVRIAAGGRQHPVWPQPHGGLAMGAQSTFLRLLFFLVAWLRNSGRL
jgi:hypothetical protein